MYVYVLKKVCIKKHFEKTKKIANLTKGHILTTALLADALNLKEVVQRQ